MKHTILCILFIAGSLNCEAQSDSLAESIIRSDRAAGVDTSTDKYKEYLARQIERELIYAEIENKARAKTEAKFLSEELDGYDLFYGGGK